MNKYYLKILRYVTSQYDYTEIEADFIKFEGTRVNFYTSKGELIHSYPSGMTIIYKIDYNGK